MELTERERRIRARLMTDFAHYAAKCLKIRAKDGRIVPMKMNSAQEYIHARLEEQLITTGRVRALVLKGRQQGCSTYVQARFYWKVTHRRGVRAFILTHLDDASRGIYGMVQRFYENCPEAVRPQAARRSSKEMIFGRLDSGYAVGTAKSSGVGRAHTLQYFHGSEVAYWAQAENHVSGILQAVPDEKGTEIILESTSAGAAGLFYQMCMEAQKGRGGYIFIFVPWFWQTEYRKTPPEDFIPSVEEREYQTQYGLDDAQIYWRHIKIEELGGIWTFRREYPSSAEEAFHSDRPNALWDRAGIDRSRRHPGDAPDMKRIVIAVDPAMTSGRSSDETGIIVAGLGTDNRGYIIADLSGRMTPAQWASAVVSAYYKYQADRVVAEVNQGGDLVEHTLRGFDPAIAYKSVYASRGKIARAEPIAALDARGLVHHLGAFPALEDQMCRFDPLQDSKSPDRVDARVWALTELMLTARQTPKPMIWQPD
jgi:phage terminase large subunit-like protein